MASRPVIAIAGLACETSAFTPARTLAPAFHPRRDHEVIDEYTFLHPGTSLGDAADWRGALIGHALPGGIVVRAAFEELAAEIISRLSQIANSTPIDGLWFDIHGAMVVEGLHDAEFELLTRMRKVVGPDCLVSASMDLHGNVSRNLVHQTDLITCYRMAPHEDETETKERACRNLVDLLRRGCPSRAVRPLKAWIPLPILLPGEQTSTRVEPAKGLYALVPRVEETEGVIDAAVWVGYAWADEPRNRAAVVVTGWDQEAVAAGAHLLAQRFWSAHADFHFVGPTGSFAECIDRALASEARPFFISDSGDNPTAGGSGDVTWGLTRLLERSEFQGAGGPVVIYASLPGPAAVRTMVDAGVGATVTVTAGAEVDAVHAGPITMTGRVHAIRHGDKDALVEAVLQVGSVFAILTQLRKPYHHERDFTDLQLAPRAANLVIVKIGYLEPELFDMAADWMLALTPGGVDQDLVRLGHHRIRRPIWPFDTTFPSPDLCARVIPASNDTLSGPDE
ncbi:M81 family metallopeptidase [Aspergillus saccharolyticus JOP 1030-1]|uniref:MlrC C-terminus superfamily protein n=1 Tax=Aspergillus saccharolyticus JOP 1030-1 TaxID=1450539 RepID=A0A318ZYU2_9EURO|nr:MlrC C-terminus superfamily protein [Aspergillus saccharolyticus JOP 1030-1]PYH49370.1 MlrC C-terminus superfamily protein [Aspergillus saccharolyticus JOP 1030-1]